MPNQRKHATYPYVFYPIVSLTSFLIVLSRRPDAVFNPQFWAEDGKVWYADAYNRGVIYSLFTPVTGYYQTISRLVACFAQIVPLAYAPLSFNLTAISVKILVVNFLLSERLAKLIPSFAGRALIAFFYLAMPHSYETNANLTNVQWHLALLSFFIIIAGPSGRMLWRLFDCALVLISALSGPFCLFLLPIAVILSWKRRQPHMFVLLVILSVGAMIQVSALLISPRPSVQPLGATVGLFLKIVGGHLFISAIIGERGYSWLINHSIWTEGMALVINLLTFA
jgi:hypothetical protein